MSAQIDGVGGGAVDGVEVARYGATLEGEVLLPGSDAYEAARAVWNGMIDRRPALITRCATPEDVARSVQFARAHGLPIAVKGAGHNIAGSAVRDGALVIDLSSMRGVTVDPSERVATVEPGATLGDVDAATQTYGLAVPTGINSTTGIAGLTLGGGFGWLSRKHGMTVDDLLGVDLVTADGAHVRADATENPDLFWALRGGGGNFGVVTSFRFRLHPVGPEVLAGLVVHPLEDAREVMRGVAELSTSAPDELSAWMVLRKAPPLPFLPEEWHGREVLVLAMMYAGEMEAGEAAAAAVRALGSPIADVVGPHPYVGWQQAFDPLLTEGARNYWKSHALPELSVEVIDRTVEAAGRLPSDECEIFLPHMGGAINRVPADSTAYPHREAEWVINIHGRWQDPEQDEECMGWTRDVFRSVAPYSTGGVYVNFMSSDEAERVRAAYGTNFTRLAAVKRTWDPENVFQANQNIRPAVPV